MNNTSVECARPYDDSSDGSYYLAALNALTARLAKERRTYSLVLSVDDLSYEDKSYDFDSYSNWLAKAGYANVKIFKETQLVDATKELRELVDFNKLDQKLAQDIQNSSIPISQLFLASWCLLRLGRTEFDAFPAELRANHLYNILPASFKPGEEQSLQIIKATPYADATSQIEYQFIPD